MNRLSGHPDSAWSPYYSAPAGLGEDDPCFHTKTYMSVGPSSNRKTFLIPSYNCQRCGRILRSGRDISWQEYFWIRRWNKGCERNRRRL